MRRLRHLVLALPLAIAPVVACEGDEGNSGPDLNLPDGGTFDSAVPVTDSGPPVPATSVTITVNGNEGPRAEVLVVFHDASGAVLETKRTGADGKATSTGATPAIASALFIQGTSRSIVTWTGLEAGDELAVNDFDSEGERGSYDVSLTTPLDGAARYEAYVGGCGTNGLGWTGVSAQNLPVSAGCVRAQNAVLARAIDANNVLLGHAFIKNVGLPSGDPLPVTVGSFAAPADVIVSSTNLPPDSSSFVSLSEVVGSVGYGSWGGGGDAQATFRTAAGFAEALQANGYVGMDGGSALGLIRRVAAPTAEISLDFANALPHIVAGETDASDPRRPAVSWTAGAPTTAADGGIIRLLQQIDDDTQVAWTFVVPPGVTSVKAPALPTEADDWLPDPEGGVFQSFLDIVFVDSDLVPSYAAFRRQQGTLFQSSAYGTLPTLPTNSTLKISRWGNAG